MARSPNVPQGEPISLEASESALASEISDRLKSILERITNHEQLQDGEVDKLGDLAHELHLALKARGLEPTHRKYMLKNRGVAPTDVEFYRHVHPVEDLLSYLADRNVNNEPADVTIGGKFKVEVYTRRWGHVDSHTIVRTRSGWTFEHIGQQVKAGRDARVAGKDGTGFLQILDHDSVNYPAELPGYFQWLWEQAAERGLTHEQVQAALEQLTEWISTCERNSPAGVFGGFK